jgi:hypothetical protein
VLKDRRGRVRRAGRPDARRDDEGVVDALRRGGATPQAAGRRSNPKGWRHLRRRSALLVVRDAPVASPSSSRLDRLASAASAAAWVFQHPARHIAAGSPAKEEELESSALAMTYDFTYFVLTKNTQGVTHEQSLFSPKPGGNCMNWVLGHILAQRTTILKLAGRDPVWSPEDAAVYARGSTPLEQCPTAALSFESLVRDLERTQELLKSGLAEISEEALAAPGLPNIPGGVQPVGVQLAVMNFHEAYHAGQTGLLRRLIGLPGAIQ